MYHTRFPSRIARIVVDFETNRLLENCSSIQAVTLFLGSSRYPQASVNFEAPCIASPLTKTSDAMSSLSVSAAGDKTDRHSPCYVF